MKIQYMSDLHLEFYRGSLPAPPKKVGDVLVLAGDIHLGADAIPWIENCAHIFEHVIYIAGNHEFYGKTMQKVLKAIPASLAGYTMDDPAFPDAETPPKPTKIFDPITNVHFLDNDSIVIDDVKFIGSTLWSKADPALQYMMNDFNKIKYKYPGGYGKFSTEEAQELFFKNKLWIKMEIDPQLKNVIVTHHAPSMQSSATERYANSSGCIHTGYATDILDEFTPYRDSIACWIHGHTHQCADYVESDIHVVANTFGYVAYEEVPEFSWEKTIEI